MAEENTEVQTEENTTDETVETQQEEKETPIQKTEHTDTEKRAYARMKEAEEQAKKAKAELKKVQDELAKAKLPISDVDAILEVQSATSGMDTEEVAELRLRANALGVSLSEARKDKNYQLWQKGHKEEVEKANSLKPNTNQGEVDTKPKTWQQEFAEAKTIEEQGKVLDKYGLNPLNPRKDYQTL